MPSPVGEGGSRRLTDEAPDKIQFFAKRKSSKTYPIKYFALYSDCKYTKNEGYLPNLIKKYLVQAIGEDFLAALEKQYLIKTPHSSRFACHLPPPGKACFICANIAVGLCLCNLTICVLIYRFVSKLNFRFAKIIYQ